MTREDFMNRLKDFAVKHNLETNFTEADNLYMYDCLGIKLNDEYAINISFDDDTFGFLDYEDYSERVLIYNIDEEEGIEYTPINEIDDFDYTTETYNQLISLLEEVLQFFENLKIFGYIN